MNKLILLSLPLLALATAPDFDARSNAVRDSQEQASEHYKGLYVVPKPSAPEIWSTTCVGKQMDCDTPELKWEDFVTNTDKQIPKASESTQDMIDNYGTSGDQNSGGTTNYGY